MKIRISPEASLVFRIEESELRLLHEGKRLNLKLPLPGAFEMNYEVEASAKQESPLELQLEWDRRVVRALLSARALDFLESLEGKREGIFAELGSGASRLSYGVELDLKPKKSSRPASGGVP